MVYHGFLLYTEVRVDFRTRTNNFYFIEVPLLLKLKIKLPQTLVKGVRKNALERLVFEAE